METGREYVLRRLRMVFGSRVRYLVSGSAAMPVWLLRWFDAIGLPVYEVYGISENVIPVAVNSSGSRKLGAVGKPLLPNEIKLTMDGEILVRGPGVFKGYQDRKEESNLRFHQMVIGTLVIWETRYSRISFYCREKERCFQNICRKMDCSCEN